MNGHLGGTQNTLHIIALSRLAPPAKILDMGAGAGETVGLLRDMGYDARGIDCLLYTSPSPRDCS
mgnify:CR=1 FL=1